MALGTGFYKVLNNGKTLTFDHWDNIPEEFDNLIAFQPDIPPGPHTPEEHDEIETLPAKLAEFMKREHNARRN